MPTIPASNGQRIGPAETPALRAPVEAFGGNSRPVDTSGMEEIVNQIREHEIQRANQIAITDAGGQMSMLETDTLHGPNGVLNTQGRDAFTAPDVVAKAWQDGTAKIEAGLTNDAQKGAFRQLTATHWNAINAQVQSHVAQQRHAYDSQVTDGAVNAEFQAAANSFTDAARGELAVTNTRAVLTNYWERNGHGDGNGGLDIVGQQHVASRISMIRAGVLEQLANTGHDRAAESYFQAHQSELVGDALTKGKALVDNSSTRAASQEATRTIVSTATSLSAALADVAKIDEPKLQDETAKRVRQYFADQATNIREQRAATVDRVGKTIVQSGGNWDAVPFADKQQLTPAETIAFQHEAGKIRNPERETDPNTFASLWNMAGLSPASRKKFESLDLTKYRDKLSDSDYTKVQAEQLRQRLHTQHADEAEVRYETRRDESRDRGDEVRAETRAYSDSVHTARQKEAADKKKAAQASHDQMIRDLMSGKKPTIPGAPIVKPSAPLPTKKTSLVPQDWIDHAASGDTAYADYLRHFGVDVG